MEQCSRRTLEHLKKRNFVNVIKVDAPFKKRLHNFCAKNNKPMDLASYE